MYSIELQTIIKIKIIKFIPVFLARAFGPFGLKNWFKSHNLHFDISGKLSIIRCDRYILEIHNIFKNYNIKIKRHSTNYVDKYKEYQNNTQTWYLLMIKINITYKLLKIRN